MGGFGRTGKLVRRRALGRRPGPHDDGQGPDQLVPAARARWACATRSPRHFETKMFYGGLTYNSHPVGLAAALATISVYEEDDLIENAAPARAGDARAPRAARGEAPVRRARTATSACSGSSTSSAEDPRTPLTPFNGTSDEMKAIGKYFREHGLYTFAAEQLDPHATRRCASPRSSWRRASRSSTPRSTSPTRPSTNPDTLSRAKFEAGPAGRPRCVRRVRGRRGSPGRASRRDGRRC